MAARYRGILFDLFGTLITFDPAHLPELDLPGGPVRTTVGGLEGVLAEWVPGVALAAFWQALLSVSDEMARARAHEHVELPSRERFRRALERVGCDDTHLAEAAVHLSRAHMGIVASATTLTDDHQVLPATHTPPYRLGLGNHLAGTGPGWSARESCEARPASRPDRGRRWRAMQPPNATAGASGRCGGRRRRCGARVRWPGRGHGGGRARGGRGGRHGRRSRAELRSGT